MTKNADDFVPDPANRLADLWSGAQQDVLVRGHDALTRAGVPNEYRLEQRIVLLAEERDRLRAALVGLVGASTAEELDQMELGLRLMPVPDEDRAVTLNAVHVLRATLK